MFLVTGGAGFIGRHVVKQLNDEGYSNIVIVDDLMDGRKCMNLVGLDFADYLDWRVFMAGKKLPIDPEQLELIIHLGAISDTMFTNGKILMEQNYTFSKLMLNLASKAQCAFTYASTAGVYGDGANGFKELPECEQPKTPYAVSKWAFDRLVRRRFPKFDASNGNGPYAAITGLRYFNVYGPGEDHKGPMTSFVHKCFTAVKNNAPIELFEGSENIKRDFIYVTDAAKITVNFALQDTPGIFNVGTGIATSFFEVAAEVKKHFPNVEINTVPFPALLSNGYQYHTQADIRNLRKWLGNTKTAQMHSVAAGVAAYKQEFFE